MMEQSTMAGVDIQALMQIRNLINGMLPAGQDDGAMVGISMQTPALAFEPTPVPAWNTQSEKRKVKDLFLGLNAPDTVVQTVWTQVNDNRVPYRKVDPTYRWRKDLFQSVAVFMASSDGDALLISGPHGSGKTSAVVQFCAAINRPVVTVTGRKNLEIPDLVGMILPTVNGGAKWVDGKLTEAVRYGYVLVLNEAFLCNPGELAGLNDIAEGAPLCLLQNGGEVVHPHPDFRLVFTDNSGGQGDRTGQYAGVVAQNLSLLDRCCRIFVDYPTEAEELLVLQAALKARGKDLDDDLIKIYISVAQHIRDLYSKEADIGGVQLSVTMSTRTLRRWLLRSIEFERKGANQPRDHIARALDFALTRTLDWSERKAIHEVASGKFGNANWVDVIGSAPGVP